MSGMASKKCFPSWTWSLRWIICGILNWYIDNSLSFPVATPLPCDLEAPPTKAVFISLYWGTLANVMHIGAWKAPAWWAGPLALCHWGSILPPRVAASSILGHRVKNTEVVWAGQLEQNCSADPSLNQLPPGCPTDIWANKWSLFSITEFWGGWLIHHISVEGSREERMLFSQWFICHRRNTTPSRNEKEDKRWWRRNEAMRIR